MLKTIVNIIARTLIILAAAGLVAGAAYFLVPSSSAAAFGDRGRPIRQLDNPQLANRQFANRPPEANNVTRGDFDRGERGFSLTRGVGEFLVKGVILSVLVAVIVLVMSLFRRQPKVVA
ncbi:MAG: hypothetical protein HY740_10510 [Chloroflexi bacterium]|nr:hypothetical protein [Chloroflexota bacterium]